MPIAASTQIVAAVVMPTVLPLSRKIAPAPRNPIPCTILEAIRVLPVSPRRCAITPDRSVNNAAPRDTNRLVRIPAGRLHKSRSTPMAAPSSAATVKRNTIWSRGSIPAPPLGLTGILQLELRHPRPLFSAATPPRFAPQHLTDFLGLTIA